MTFDLHPEKKIDDQTRAQYLLRVPPKASVSYRAYPSIQVGFDDILTWVAVHKDQLTNNVDTNVQLYLKARADHEQSVSKHLDMIFSKAAGKALLGTSKGLKKLSGALSAIVILPWWEPVAEANAFAAHDPGSFFKLKGMTKGGQTQETEFYLPGMMFHSQVRFSVSMWPCGANEAGLKGPASAPDEVLFHELVHAVRQIQGKNEEVPVTGDYDNTEEYYAILLANIYVSEKGSTLLRASHHGHTSLNQPNKFLDQPIQPTPRHLLNALLRQQTHLFAQFAEIGEHQARFNPIRQHYHELQQQHAAKHGHH